MIKIVYLLIGSAALLWVMDQYHPSDTLTTTVRPLSVVASTGRPPGPPPAGKCACMGYLDAGYHRRFLDCETAEHVALMEYVYAAAEHSQALETKGPIIARMEHIRALLQIIRSRPCTDLRLCNHVLAALTAHFSGCDDLIGLFDGPPQRSSNYSQSPN